MKATIFMLIISLKVIPDLFSQTISYNQEFQINTYTKGSQNHPVIASLYNGEIFVCWHSDGQDGSGYGVFGQLFDCNGNKVGSEFQVNTYTNRWQYNPAITALHDSGFVIFWDSNGQDGSGYGVFGQLFDSSGSKKGNEFQVNAYVNNDQRYPIITTLLNNDFVIFWGSNGQDGSGYGVFGQLFNKYGNKEGGEFQVYTYINNNQRRSAITTLPNGGFVICWESYGQDGSGYGIFGQLFDDSGNKIGTEFQVYTYTNGYQVNPAIITLPNGDFVICWRSNDQDGSSFGISMQLFDATGNKIGAEFQVNSNTSTYPFRIALHDGGFVICWSSYGQDGSSLGIFGKYFLNEPIIHQLTAFSMMEPQHDASLNTIHPTFKWHKATEVRKCYYWEVAYDFYIDTDINFSNPRIISDIYDTTYTIDSLNRAQTYFWKVLAKNLGGDSLWSSETWGFYVKPTAPKVDKKPTALQPMDIQLNQNHPNPFNATTEIKYSLPKGRDSYHVTLKIYDALGRLVKKLVNENQSTGEYSVIWDGTDMAGTAVTSGVYFYTLGVGEFTLTKKMLLLE